MFDGEGVSEGGVGRVDGSGGSSVDSAAATFG